MSAIRDRTTARSHPYFAHGTAIGALAADEPVWFSFFTRSRSEKKADTRLRMSGHESFVPTAPRTRQWHDRRVVVDLPLFPSYLFARVLPSALGAVLCGREIVDVVRFGDRPAIVQPEEIENIARFARALAVSGCEPPLVEFEPGERVRVKSGDFAGVEAVVLEVRGRRRVLIGIRSIRLAFDVDISVSHLQRIR